MIQAEWTIVAKNETNFYLKTPSPQDKKIGLHNKYIYNVYSKLTKHRFLKEEKYNSEENDYQHHALIMFAKYKHAVFVICNLKSLEIQIICLY